MATSTIRESIKQVLGEGQLTLAQIVEALVAAGMTTKSKNLKAYVSVTLSQNPDVFERVARGSYGVRKDSPTADLP